jgi:outer membrane protein TolC
VATLVRLICYDMLLRADEVQLVERSLTRVQSALEETRARNRAGLATDYHVLRLQVELANLEPSLLHAHNAQDAARRRLAVELGIDDPRRIDIAASESLDDTSNFQNRDPDSLEVLVRTAMAWRSDLRQLEQAEVLRRTELRHAKVEYLPTVSAFGSWDVNAQQSGSPDFFGDENSRATSKMAGVRINLPLFTGLQRDARVDRRQAMLRQAEIQTQLGRRRAAAQVQDLVAQLEESRARERGQRLAVSQAERGFQIALARYRRGVGSQLEVTDAEVALRQSEFNRAQAAHDVLSTQARLELGIGRVSLLDETPEETK